MVKTIYVSRPCLTTWNRFRFFESQILWHSFALFPSPASFKGTRHQFFPTVSELLTFLHSNFLSYTPPTQSSSTPCLTLKNSSESSCEGRPVSVAPAALLASPPEQRAVGNEGKSLPRPQSPGAPARQQSRVLSEFGDFEVEALDSHSHSLLPDSPLEASCDVSLFTSPRAGRLHWV